jgi:hypothetical protein
MIKFLSEKNNYLCHTFSTREQLLPFPYQTNYYNHETDSSRHKSQEHCILDYMKNLEYNECKCNRKWFHNRLNEQKLMKFVQ